VAVIVVAPGVVGFKVIVVKPAHPGGSGLAALGRRLAALSGRSAGHLQLALHG